MRKGRKAIIAELKEKKKYLHTAAEQVERLLSENNALQARYAEELSKNDGFRRRLEELEYETEYTKSADRGTVVAVRRVDPEHIELTGKGYRYKTADVVRHEMCSVLAEELFKRGLVKCVTEPDLDGSDFLRVTARVDVVPWDAVSRRREVVMFQDRDAGMTRLEIGKF